MALRRRPEIGITIDSINLHISMLQDALEDLKRKTVGNYIKNKIPIEEFKVKRGDSIEAKGILKFIIKSSSRLARSIQKDKTLDDLEKGNLVGQCVLINQMTTPMLARLDSLEKERGKKAYDILDQVFEEGKLVKTIKVARRAA